MKCFKHQASEAIGICAYCGRALCVQCIQNPAALRLVCSDACNDALSLSDKTLETVAQQTVRSAQASAFYCYLCAGLSAAAAIVAWFMLPSPFLILFTGGCAVVLFLSGLWYGQASKKR